MIPTGNFYPSLIPFFIITMLLALPTYSDDSQCATLSPHINAENGQINYYELDGRIDTPIIPEKLTQLIPSYSLTQDKMPFILQDEEAKILPHAFQMEYNESSLPSGITPLIMIHPTGETHSRQLLSLEIAAISSTDCVPGLIESSGKNVVCTKNGDVNFGKSPYAGNYKFRYYITQNDNIVLDSEKDFTVPNNAFLPIHPASLRNDGTYLEGRKLIARGLIFDISPEGIFPDTDKPSYVSIQYIPEKLSDAQSDRADKFIYFPFSAGSSVHPNTNAKDTDYIKAHFDNNSYDINLYEMTKVAHVAARYTMSKEVESDEVYTINTCDELRALNGSSHTNVELDDDIVCNPNTPFTPIELSNAINFDGKNRTISGIRIDTLGAGGAGIFKEIPGNSSISNLNLSDIEVVGGSDTGILAGMAGNYSDTVTISHVRVIGNNSKVYGHNNVGGLIGSAGKVGMEYVSSDASLLVNCSFGGGLVGHIGESSISNSYSQSEIKAPLGGCDSTLGGIAGRATATTFEQVQFQGGVFGEARLGGIAGTLSSYSTIKNSSAEGTVQILKEIVFDGKLKIIGGIAGVVENSTIENTYVRGTVIGEQVVGGIAGQLSGTSIIKNSFSIAGVTSARGNNDELPHGGLIVGQLIDTSVVLGAMFEEKYGIYNEQKCEPGGPSGLMLCTAGGWYSDDATYNVCSALTSPEASILDCGSQQINDIYEHGTSQWDNDIWYVGRYRIPSLRDLEMLPPRSRYDMKYLSPF